MNTEQMESDLKESLSRYISSAERILAETTEQKQLIKELVEGIKQALYLIDDESSPHTTKLLAELLTKAKAHV